MDYDLGELDVALSSAVHQASDVRGPPGGEPRGGTRTPGTRRGSLVPVGVSTLPSLKRSSKKGGSDPDGPEDKKTRRKVHKAPQPELNLFTFDLREQVQDVLLSNHTKSRVSYHEYAVFSPPPGDSNGAIRSPSIMAEGKDGLERFHEAIGNGYGLDVNGAFTEKPEGEALLRGRVRQVIAYRRQQYGENGTLEAQPTDGLVLTADDYNSLGLHSATLPSIQRTTVESHFWDAKRNTIYLILSFSNNPKPPYDFLSMTYKLKSKTTTALIRRSFDARWHQDDALDEYERRLDSSRSRWSHPLVLPIVLLQVQLYRTEEAVMANNGEVLLLEAHVDGITGTTGQANAEAFRRNKQAQAKAQRAAGHNSPGGPLRRLSTFRDIIGEKIGRRSDSGAHPAHPARPAPIHAGIQHGPRVMHEFSGSPGNISAQFDVPLGTDYVPPQTIHLMKEAHEVLKGAIQLLDTLRWMERAVKLIIQVGDELDARLKEIKRDNAEREAHRAQRRRADDDDQVSPGTTAVHGESVDSASDSGEDDDDDEEDLFHHWHEMRQYLDCTWRLCTALETDRRMSELRCRAQIDIIYSKMAQEDNNLNARMAVASTRDSSSMKALAVITAIFLPGEYIGTLFGLSMFNWARGTAADPMEGEDNAPWLPKFTVMPTFWIYWAFTVPITLVIITTWRAWWIQQDRYFRRHLSTELSNERYWTVDGQPRELETTFVQDFFSILDISGGRNTSNTAIVGERHRNTPAGGGGGGGVRSALSPGFGGSGLGLSRTRSIDKELRPGGLGLLRRDWSSSMHQPSTNNQGNGHGTDGLTFRGGGGGGGGTAPNSPGYPGFGLAAARGVDSLAPYDGKTMTGTTDDNDDARSIAMPLPTTPRRFRTVSFAQYDNRAKKDRSDV